MTERGCLNCEYLIPGCESCVLTTRNTGIPLYALASYFKDPKQQYLDCELCGAERYVEKGSSGTKTKCTHCAAQWEGCSDCGETGGSCLACYQTHLLEGNSKTPCTRCDFYMYGCVKCVDKMTCT